MYQVIFEMFVTLSMMQIYALCPLNLVIDRPTNLLIDRKSHRLPDCLLSTFVDVHFEFVIWPLLKLEVADLSHFVAAPHHLWFETSILQFVSLCSLVVELLIFGLTR